VYFNGNFLRLLVFAALLLGCAEGSGPHDLGGQMAVSHTVSKAALETLKGKRVFFGHQSVGQNIVQGLEELCAEEPATCLRIVTGGSEPDLEEPGLLHSKLGRNRQPESKLEAFQKALEAGLGQKADLAMVKFCYVDITAETDLEKLFLIYKERMNKIQEEFPNLRLAHVTVPLMGRAPGLKSLIKRVAYPIFGKSPGWPADNLARMRFNDMLIAEYGSRAPVFDLARAESTYPDGRRCFVRQGSKTVYALAPEYTTDGGHLNALGRKWAARAFVAFLAEALGGPGKGD